MVMQAVDKVNGGLVVLGGGEDEHGVRFVVADGIDRVRQIALRAQVITRPHYELPFGVIQPVGALGIVKDRVPIEEQRGRYVHGVRLGIYLLTCFFVSARERAYQERARNCQKIKILVHTYINKKQRPL